MTPGDGGGEFAPPAWAPAGKARQKSGKTPSAREMGLGAITGWTRDAERFARPTIPRLPRRSGRDGSGFPPSFSTVRSGMGERPLPVPRPLPRARDLPAETGSDAIRRARALAPGMRVWNAARAPSERHQRSRFRTNDETPAPPPAALLPRVAALLVLVRGRAEGPLPAAEPAARGGERQAGDQRRVPQGRGRHQGVAAE